ncbi:hypothetical protein HMI55_006201, partial [Coelomomyces lativittatus]
MEEDVSKNTLHSSHHESHSSTPPSTGNGKEGDPGHFQLHGPVLQDIVLHGLTTSGVLRLCVDLFFHYPWHNVLHGVITDLLLSLLTPPLHGVVLGTKKKLILQVCFQSTPWFNSLSRETEENARESPGTTKIMHPSKRSTTSWILSASLCEHILRVFPYHQSLVNAPKAPGFGLLGHVLLLSEWITVFLNTCAWGTAVFPLYNDWVLYMMNLKPYLEQKLLPLGGLKP